MRLSARLCVLLVLLAPAGLCAQDVAPPAELRSDPVLRAMAEELQRSKDELKLRDMQRPYYVQYSVVDLQQYQAEAEFGGLRVDQYLRSRAVRAVVRIGDYKQDSYYGAGEGTVELLPIDDDVAAIRHQLWLATDSAYKRAAAALTQKQATLKQFEAEQGVDDFSHEPPAHAFEPQQSLPADLNSWRDTVKDVSGLYTLDSKLESWRASASFMLQTRYFLNSEGTALRQVIPFFSVNLNGSEQSADGMRLDLGRTWAVAQMNELPRRDEIRAAAEQAIAKLGELRVAPLVEEEYRGPVLLAPSAASSIISALVAPNISGRKPRFGTFARTSGEYATSYKFRVLPDFLTLVDDPTVVTAGQRTLLGHYNFDDEGVAAQPVTVVQKGVLVNYLLGRQPIRDFTVSNGHGRAAPAGPPGPHTGNLFVRPSTSESFDALKTRLRKLCKDQGLPYGYLVTAMATANTPRLLYRVYSDDGHEELVRGAAFNQLDTRALRSDLIAAGDDAEVDNRADNVPSSVIAPSFLFDELEIKRSNLSKERLPLYPPPAADARSSPLKTIGQQ